VESEPTAQPTGDEDEAATAPADESEVESPEQPDDEAGPAVEPIEGDQGEYVEQAVMPANPGVDTGFDPNRPVRTSPPPADMQEGVARDIPGDPNSEVPPGGGDPEGRPVGDDQSGDEGDDDER
jgi:hypothetical protein